MASKNIASLGIGINANTKPFSKSLARLKYEARSTFMAISRFAGAITAGIGLGKLVSEYNEAYSILRRGGSVTFEQLKSDMQATVNVAKQVPVSFTDAAKIVDVLGDKTGATGKDLEAFSTSVARLSVVTKTSAEELASGLGSTFNKFNLNVADSTKNLDFLFKACQATGTQVGSVVGVLNQYGGTLQSVGMNYETSIAVLTNATKQGLKIETLGTSFQTFERKLAKAGATAREQAISFKLIVEAIKKAPSALDASAIGMRAFGSTGAEMATFIRQGGLEVGNFITEINKLDESLLKSTNEGMTFKEAFQLIWNNFSASFGDVNSKLNSVLPSMITLAQNVGSGFSEILTAASPVLNFILNSLSYILKGWGSILSGMKNVVVFIFNNLKPAFMEFLTFIKVWINDGFVAAFNKIKQDFAGVIDAIKEKLEAFGYVWGGLKKVANEATQSIVSSCKDMWDKLEGHSYVKDTRIGVFKLGDAFKDTANKAKSSSIDIQNSTNGLNKATQSTVDNMITGQKKEAAVNKKRTKSYESMVSSILNSLSSLFGGSFGGGSFGGGGGLNSIFGTVDSIFSSIFSGGSDSGLESGGGLFNGFFASGGSFQVPSMAGVGGGQDNVPLGMYVDPGEFVSVSRVDPAKRQDTSSSINQNITCTSSNISKADLSAWGKQVAYNTKKSIAEDVRRGTILGKTISGRK